MGNRLSISLKRDEALRATRVTIGKLRLVYVLVADKPQRYREGRSRIVYIGTTKKGVARVAQSAAARAEEILSLHGVRAFEARIVTCSPRQNVATWRKLERALLLGFRERFGQVPRCNSHGKKMRVTDEFGYFAKKRILSIIDELK